MKKRLNEVKRLQELAGIIKENNVGSNFTQVINSLSNDEKNKLLQLSKNVIEKAKKSGFTLYVNLNNYSWGDIIEFCIKHNHRDIESDGGKPEYHFMNDFKYKVERGVKISPKLEFDVTTGKYDGPWDENTIDVNRYLDFFKK
jgi:hypothetical protein